MNEKQFWFSIFQFLALNDLVQCSKVNKKFNCLIKTFYLNSPIYSIEKQWLNIDHLIKECNYRNYRNYQQSDSIIVPNTFVRSLGLFFDIFFVDGKAKIEFWSAFNTKRFILIDLPPDFKVGYNFQNSAPFWNEFEKMLVWVFKNYSIIVNCADITKIDIEFKRANPADDVEKWLSESLSKQISISDNFNNELPNRFVYPTEFGTIKIELSSVGRGGTPLFNVVVEGDQNSPVGERSQSFRISASRIFPFGYQNRFVFIPFQRNFFWSKLERGLIIFDSTFCDDEEIRDEFLCPEFVTYNDIKRRLFVVTSDQIKVYQKNSHCSKWIKSQITDEELNHFYDKKTKLWAKFVHFCPFTNKYISLFNESKDALTLDRWWKYIDPFLLKFKDLKNLSSGSEYKFVEINYSDMCENFNVKPYKTLIPIDQMSHDKSTYIHDQGYHGQLNNKKFTFRRQTKTQEGFLSFKKIKKGNIVDDNTNLGALHYNRIIMENDFINNIPQTLIQQRQFNVY